MSKIIPWIPREECYNLLLTAAYRTVISDGGDGWGLIVCRYITIEEVIEQILLLDESWIVNTNEENSKYVHKGYEGITVIDWDTYQQKDKEEILKTFDSVFMII